MILTQMALRRRGPGALIAAAAALCVAAVILALPDATAPLRERLFDGMIGGRTVGPSPVWVIDIGAQNEAGADWTRGDLARLIARLAATKPAVIGLDILLSQDCAPSADNAALQAAIAAAPVVTGFVVPGAVGAMPHPQPPMAVMQSVPGWNAAGAEAACDAFQTASVGAALISLAGGRDGRVRTAPAAAFVAGQPFPGIGVELARRAEGRSVAILGAGDPAWLQIGGPRFPLDANGQFRFVPTPPDHWAGRTTKAEVILADQMPEFAQNLVFLVGSTLPEKGGLRPSRASPLHGSVYLQADIVGQLLAGTPFSRPAYAASIEAAVAIAGGVLAVALALILTPAMAALAATVIAAIWSGLTWTVAVWGQTLLDPLLPAVAILAAAAVVLLAEARASRRAESNLSRRMRQHLPGVVVDRVTDGSAPLRLPPQLRQITALFTDIEGFSDLTRRVSPQDLVQVLDRYFTGITRIIAARGGMVDKIVGDAVHAFFNAPVDQPDHVDQAIAAAAEIRDFAAGFAKTAAIGFGRTRIGVETGPALLGDIGQGGRTDYTAHGDAVNMAARLQEASKTLGTTVLIGPRAAALTSVRLAAAMEIDLRSFGLVQVSTLPDASRP